VSDADRWDRVKELFQAALGREPHHRPAFLRDACGDDHALRTEVESLLDAHQRAGSFAERSPVERIGASAAYMQALNPGARFGIYEIAESLGTGGMGEVYRARDTQLGRDVAIKVLPAAFLPDRERLARLEREARLLAALNHPHIGAIYGIENVDGVRALVLELIEGETLADRIARGPMSITDALPIARQIAEALEAAHEKGIVHRDLKPANIKIMPSGTVKVLDFGLAKTVDAPGPHLSQSPTISIGRTAEGVLVGTAAYMSPEQARGQKADKRADIWAFGCVLYETLTGRRAFAGETISDHVAAILEREPDWTLLPNATPVEVRRLLWRCLTKDPLRRLRDVGDARIELEGKPSNGPPSAPVSTLRKSFVFIVGAFLLGSLVTLPFGAAYFRRRVLDTATMRFSVYPAEGTVFQPRTTGEAVTVSPDGRSLAYAAYGHDGRRMLWIRRLDALNASSLAGTEDAAAPFWSPDSHFLGFFAEGKLKTIAGVGGPTETVCDVANPGGGAWNRDNVIVFAALGRPLFSVGRAGGEASPATVLDTARGELNHLWPSFLPDGRHFLYLVESSHRQRTIFVGSLDSKNTKPLLTANSNAIFAVPAYLLFLREQALLAQPFNTARLTLSGEPTALAESVDMDDTGSYHGGFSASNTGVLTIHSGGGEPTQLTWFSRSGRPMGRVGGPGDGRPSLSPDDKIIAVHRRYPQTGTGDIWLLDASRGIPSRFTFDQSDYLPLWSPDGSRLVFASDRNGFGNLYEAPASGAGTAELILKTPELKLPQSWSPDGRYIVYGVIDPKTKADLWLFPLFADRKPFLFLQTQFNELQGQISPNGRWIAYASDESGAPEVYIRSFAERGQGKWRISAGGGAQPQWRRDGKELFYLAADRKLMAVRINGESPFVAGTPTVLFQTQVNVGAFGARNSYVASSDGQRFLVDTLTDSKAASPVTLVFNWPSVLAKRP
jgi:serine/threonine protein kinase/WD40 repeat protein